MGIFETDNEFKGTFINLANIILYWNYIKKI